MPSHLFLSRGITAVLLVLPGILNPAGAQTKLRLDSLVTALSAETADTARCRILVQLAGELHASDTTATLSFLDQAEVLASKHFDNRALGRCHEIRGELDFHFGRYDQAILDYDRALAAYSEADDDLGYFQTLKDKGNVHLLKAEYQTAMNYYETALAFFRKAGHSEGMSNCLNNMGIIYKNRGEYMEALSVYDQSIQALGPEADPMDLAEGYINMGNVFTLTGSYEMALEHYDRALVIAEEEQNRQAISLCLSNSGVIQNKAGNYDEAAHLYRRALDISRKIGDPVQISNCLINLGTNYASMGQAERGQGYVEEGMEIKVELGDQKAISNCQIHLAEIHQLTGKSGEAVRLFNEALPVKQELGDKEGIIRCHLGLARVFLDRGSYSQAISQVGEALRLAREIGALEHVVESFQIKREIAEARGSYRDAYQFAIDHQRYQDSLLNESTSLALMEMEYRHRSQQLETENENLRVQSELSAELMRKQNAFLYAMAGLAFLLAAGMGLFIYLLRKLKISSQKLEEKNLVITRQNMKLDSLNRTKDRMMSIIAHDLRGTLGNQLTAIEVLQQEEGPDALDIDSGELLGNLKHSASYSLELLENLLHWSRLEEMENYYHPEPVRLGIVVTGCISLFSESARSKNVTVVQEIDNGLMVQADRIMLETIIRNLLSNAIKFSERGGRVTVAAGEDQNITRIRVTDEGIGMSPLQISQIMENGGHTRRGTENEKGAGIGMLLVRELTTLQKGELRFQSETGKGTTVEVCFPTRV